jgi:hypothetical protein
MSEKSDPEARSSMPAANQTKAEPLPVNEHESAPPTATAGDDDPDAPTKRAPHGSNQTQPEDHPNRR